MMWTEAHTTLAIGIGTLLLGFAGWLVQRRAQSTTERAEARQSDSSALAGMKDLATILQQERNRVDGLLAEERARSAQNAEDLRATRNDLDQLRHDFRDVQTTLRTAISYIRDLLAAAHGAGTAVVAELQTDGAEGDVAGDLECPGQGDLLAAAGPAGVPGVSTGAAASDTSRAAGSAACRSKPNSSDPRVPSTPNWAARPRRGWSFRRHSAPSSPARRGRADRWHPRPDRAGSSGPRVACRPGRPRGHRPGA